MADLVRVDQALVQSLYSKLMDAVSDLPAEGDAMKLAACSAADSAAQYGSRLDEALRLFGERWDRELDFISQDLFAVASKMKSAANSLRDFDAQLGGQISAPSGQ